MTTQVIPRDARSYSIPFLVDTELAKSDQFRLEVNLSVELMDNRVAYIPAGFVTDFLSILRLLWLICHPFNTKTNLAALVHDWLYMNWEDYVVNYPELDSLTHSEARHYADAVFLDLMDRFSPRTELRNYLYYVAVRVFGRWNWRGFRTAAAQP